MFNDLAEASLHKYDICRLVEDLEGFNCIDKKGINAPPTMPRHIKIRIMLKEETPRFINSNFY